MGNLLDAEVIQRTAKGARITNRQDGFVTMVEGKPVNHTLHLILSVLTCFLWSHVWLFLTAFTGERQVSIHESITGLYIEKGSLPVHRYIALVIEIANLAFWVLVICVGAASAGHH